mmetsp:Transcript_38401/g.74475  ORF Transcript_38401/g.74475 Transcript_38401/m.74475 type:complete len:731 (-) Transcript_38401:315-2507(-)
MDGSFPGDSSASFPEFNSSQSNGIHYAAPTSTSERTFHGNSQHTYQNPSDLYQHARVLQAIPMSFAGYNNANVLAQGGEAQIPAERSIAEVSQEKRSEVSQTPETTDHSLPSVHTDVYFRKKNGKRYRETYVDSDSDYEPEVRRSTRKKRNVLNKPRPRGGGRYTLRGEAPEEDEKEGIDFEALLPVSDSLRVIDLLWDNEEFVAFRDPVLDDENYAPGYYKIITQPMDFSTLREQVNDGAVKTVRELYSKLLLISNNCRRYNGEKSYLFDLANDLDKEVLSLLRKLSAETSQKEEFYSKLATVIRQVRRHKDSKPFRWPVNEEEVPQYRSVVACPMDLYTIEQKIAQGSYKNLEEFAKDVRLIRDNCIQFNGRSHELTVLAQSTWRRFIEALRNLFPSEIRGLRDGVLSSKGSSYSNKNETAVTSDSRTPNADTGDHTVSDQDEKKIQHASRRPQEAEKLDRKDVEQLGEALESSWKWSYVLMWCETFGKYVFPKEFVFDPRLLQRSLIHGDAYAAKLAMTLLSIYKEGSRTVIDELSWEAECTKLIKAHRRECGLKQNDPDPLSNADYADLDFETKLKLLSWICEWTSEVASIRSLVVYDESLPPFTNTPLGTDGTYTYWHFLYEERATVHVYREYTYATRKKTAEEDFEFKIVATGLEETRELLSDLARVNAKSKTARYQIARLKESIEKDIIKVLEARRRQMEHLARQSRKLGMSANNIILERRVR